MKIKRKTTDIASIVINDMRALVKFSMRKIKNIPRFIEKMLIEYDKVCKLPFEISVRYSGTTVNANPVDNPLKSLDKYR
jgi:hypothetical protein